MPAGSFLHPSPTSTIHPESIPIVLGLFMVGFSGHAIMPTIRNGMANKRDYDTMIDCTYIIVAGSYMTIATLGYMMYGDQAQQQVSI
jgi:vesicular inhibitory amino acid transporter